MDPIDEAANWLAPKKLAEVTDNKEHAWQQLRNLGDLPDCDWTQVYANAADFYLQMLFEAEQDEAKVRAYRGALSSQTPIAQKNISDLLAWSRTTEVVNAVQRSKDARSALPLEIGDDEGADDLARRIVEIARRLNDLDQDLSKAADDAAKLEVLAAIEKQLSRVAITSQALAARMVKDVGAKKAEIRAALGGGQ